MDQRRATLMELLRLQLVEIVASEDEQYQMEVLARYGEFMKQMIEDTDVPEVLDAIEATLAPVS